MSGRRPHRELGIRRDASGKIHAYVRVGGQWRFKRFPGRHVGGDGSPLAPRHSGLPAVGPAFQGHPGRRHRALPATDCRSASAGGRASPAVGMVGGAPRPPPARRHRAGRCTHRARGSAPNACGVDVQPRPPGALLAVPGARRAGCSESGAGCQALRESGSGSARALLRHGPPHPRGHVGSGQRHGQGEAARRRIGGEGPLPRPGLHRAAAQRVDALPAGALGSDDADTRRVHGEGRTHADDSAQCARGRSAGRSGSLGAIGTFSTSTVWRAFARAAARVGIRGVRPYDLRHSYGTALYRVAGGTRLVKPRVAGSNPAGRANSPGPFPCGERAFFIGIFLG